MCEIEDISSEFQILESREERIMSLENFMKDSQQTDLQPLNVPTTPLKQAQEESKSRKPANPQQDTSVKDNLKQALKERMKPESKPKKSKDEKKRLSQTE